MRSGARRRRRGIWGCRGKREWRGKRGFDTAFRVAEPLGKRREVWLLPEGKTKKRDRQKRGRGRTVFDLKTTQHRTPSYGVRWKNNGPGAVRGGAA